MALTRLEIEKVVLLSRLQLTETELDRMSEQLADVVAYVDHLAQVNTDGVEPMAHAIELRNVFQADRVAAGLPREEALANAPHQNGVGYWVPAVLGE
jgi:aspartyl-tRNA(Asn)/glutamyl-tRNA(Gln) amidotransferase subunit C